MKALASFGCSIGTSADGTANIGVDIRGKLEVLAGLEGITRTTSLDADPEAMTGVEEEEVFDAAGAATNPSAIL